MGQLTTLLRKCETRYNINDMSTSEITEELLQSIYVLLYARKNICINEYNSCTGQIMYTQTIIVIGKSNFQRVLESFEVFVSARVCVC